MQAEHFSEKLVLTHQNTRHHIPEESNFNFKFNLVAAISCLRSLVREVVGLMQGFNYRSFQ